MRLYRETRGAGPPIVLLHGWAMNLRVFDALAGALAHTHEVTTIDLPGHGRSPWRAGLTPAAVVVDTAMLMPERDLPSGRLFRAMRPGITRVVIPGTSWATYVRIAKQRYVGLAKYRHLEELLDD